MGKTSTRAEQAHALGQSIWYDNIRRGLLRSGGLADLVAKGVRGLTSNPTIFEKAIISSGDYEEALGRSVAEGHSTTEIYDDLVFEDIRGACDLLLPIFKQSGGVDGRASIEVLPDLASSTEKTIAEGLRLAHMVGRPNVMVKVPATPEGIPAIRALTAQGVSINITLIFSLLQYEEVIEAYVAGLEDRLASRGSFENMASVASFFVSRVDTVCDRLLLEKARTASPGEAARCQALLGKLAIANAKMAYEIYDKTIASPRWAKLAAAGARPQRLLWASTGTKDPRYPDTYYVDALIGPDTVNTVPPATLDAFLDHGNPAPRLTEDLDGAKRAVAEFAALGFDLSRVCRGLLTDGVNAFVTSMKALVDAIGGRRAAIAEARSGRQRDALPAPLRASVDEQLDRLKRERALERLWASDPTLFTADPAHEKSIKSRLGWLRAPNFAAGKMPELDAFAEEIRAAGFTDAVLLGMGGSSLAPEVLSLTERLAGEGPGAAGGGGGLTLHVLDNTDPAAVLRVEHETAGKKALYIVASKSGGTIEIQSFERHFWQRALATADGDVTRAGASFIAITDPATRLGQLAEEKHYRKVFINPADIGGRYSALSFFGMVPGRLLGESVHQLVDTAVEMGAACGASVPADQSPAVKLGVIMGAGALAGRDKLTLIMSPPIASLGSWIEQLVAESTGKEGKGVVPIDLEPLGPPEVYGPDRLFVYVRLGSGADAVQDRGIAALERAGHPVVQIAVEDHAALGRELYRWEVATAIAGAILRVNPFDEPNVTEAKLATSALLATHATEGQLPTPEETCAPTDIDRIRAHLAAARPGDYLMISAYFMQTAERDGALTGLRVAFRDAHRIATTVGYGPRFLHSTGQLHKGGPNTGLYVQLTADAPRDLPIPGEPYSFATLRNAQALGDLQVLRRRGRRVLRVHLGADIEAGLSKLAAAFASAGGGAAAQGTPAR